jgi:DnaJ homologue, subfamily C, member 28, conserved domain
VSFDKIVESIIQEAIARGEFENLPGRGRPIDLTEYFNTPEDMRVAQSMLKNAGMVPVEIELLQEIAVLKESLNFAKDDAETIKYRKLLKEKQLQFDLLLERRKRFSK